MVLRVDDCAAEWLVRTRARERDAPPVLRELLRGRSRVEVGQAEAEAALRWAIAAGWDDDERPPLFIYDRGTVGARS